MAPVTLLHPIQAGRLAVPTRHPVTTSPAPGKGGANQPTSCAAAPDEAHGVCGFWGCLTHRFQQRTRSAGLGRGHRVPGKRGYLGIVCLSSCAGGRAGNTGSRSWLPARRADLNLQTLRCPSPVAQAAATLLS